MSTPALEQRPPHPRDEYGVVRPDPCRECGAILGGLVATTVADPEFVCEECAPPDANPGFGVHVCRRRDDSVRWYPDGWRGRLHDGDP